MKLIISEKALIKANEDAKNHGLNSELLDKSMIDNISEYLNKARLKSKN